MGLRHDVVLVCLEEHRLVTGGQSRLVLELAVFQEALALLLLLRVGLADDEHASADHGFGGCLVQRLVPEGRLVLRVG